MKSYATLFLTIIYLQAFAQSDIPINGWKSYLPQLNGEVVTQSDDKIIYGTEWSLFTIDKEENFVEFLSKVEGLTDIGINIVAYDDFNDQLITIYDNSNIDIIAGSEVFNVNNIRNNANIVGDRSINAIEIASANSSFLATAFGVVEYNLGEREFGFTTFTEISVDDITSSPEMLYIATQDGIYAANYVSNLNLADFGNWNLLGEDEGLPLVYSSEIVHYFDGSLYAATEEHLIKENDSGTFDTLYTETRNGFEFTFINSGSRLMVGVWDGGTTSEVLFFEEDGSFTTTDAGCVVQVKDAIEDENGGIWFADTWNDVRRTDGFDMECRTPRSFNSPNAETATEMSFKDGAVYVASGGVSEEWASLAFKRGFYKLQEDNSWDNFTQFNYPVIVDSSMFNLWQVESHPTLPLVYFGSYFGGLLEFNTETEENRVFNKENSSLQATQGSELRTRLSGLAFDDAGNLWMTNFGAPDPLTVLTADGEWFSFSNGNLNDGVVHLDIDGQGYKWTIAVGNNAGVMVFNDNGTINDPTDDPPPRFFNVGNSALSTNLITCLKADLNGDIWVGTAEGPIVFECGSAVFDSEQECSGSRRTVTQDSIPAFLLETEDIRVIEIDGANRKWFGTRNGIFVQSPDGIDQILHLTVDNSPLFDNTITALSYNGESGEMWIGTNNGMQTIRTDATAPARRHNESDVFAFPNPVRPDYNGPIAIKGLVEDADVKITDINGQLIFETSSLGGQAIWDGRDYNGNKASTGVYLVFSSSTDNFFDPDGIVTKILIVN
jgi:ligand-binding sensor domain-containing protein